MCNCSSVIEKLFISGGADMDTSRTAFATAAAARRDHLAAKGVNTSSPINLLRQACLSRGACGIKTLGR